MEVAERPLIKQLWSHLTEGGAQDTVRSATGERPPAQTGTVHREDRPVLGHQSGILVTQRLQPLAGASGKGCTRWDRAQQHAPNGVGELVRVRSRVAGPRGSSSAVT